MTLVLARIKKVQIQIRHGYGHPLSSASCATKAIIVSACNTATRGKVRTA